MNRLNSRTLAIVGVIAAAVLFIAVNVLSNTWMRNWRLDATEGASYSTSAQIRPVFEGIKEPIVVRVYFSEAIRKASPRHAEYFQRVRDLLQQYAELANGNLKIELFNPEPFSDVEDRAVGFGLQAVPLGQLGEVGYFGLAATNSTDDQQVIPFFNLEREQFLEYDLTKLIYSLSEPDQPKIGLLSTLPIEGGAGAPNMMGMPQQQRPWAIMQQIKDLFAVEALDPAVTAIPSDIDILMLVQPEGLTDTAAYAVDQFVLRGGKALVFVDPNAESGGMGAPPGGDKQGINKLLAAWGVRLVDDLVVGDIESAARVGLQVEGRPVAADYVAWLQLRDGHFDTNDAITGDLQQINFGTAGALEKVDGAATTVTPLISSGLQSMRIPTDKLMGMPDVVALFRDFKPQNKAEILAARITGTAASAFPEAPKGEGGTPSAPHLAQSQQPIQVVVVADTDILADRFWTQSSSFLGESIVVPMADNSNFVINALENLTGSPALSALRGRGVQSRPFELLESIRRDAEMQYRATEQTLTGRLEELQKKVSAMEVQEDGQGAAILSDEDQRTIESYRGDILETRRELREVQRALREDIDRLQGILTFINIGAVPILFGFGLIVAAMLRRRRRRTTAA